MRTDFATAERELARLARDALGEGLYHRAQRRMGELLKLMEKHPPGPDKQDPLQAERDPSALADLGIS